MPQNKQWVGSSADCIALIKPLYSEGGELRKYGSVLDGPADVNFMETMKAGITHVMTGMPKLNASWKTFKKAIIEWNPKEYAVMTKQRIREAEDDATVLR